MGTMANKSLPEVYLEEAERLTAQSEVVGDPLVRLRMLEVAEGFRRLAEAFTDECERLSRRP